MGTRCIHTMIRQLLAVSMISIVTFLCYETARSVEEPSSLPENRGDILSHPAIDHVIPSKPNDLFVVLKNGLTVLIRESASSEVVSCQVHVQTGSIYEGHRMQGGLSHFLEHIVSGGTTSQFTEAQIAERLKDLGGASNAYTSYGQTTYYINTTGPQFRNALELLLAYVTVCKFDEKEYNREKKVIIQEMQMGENNPSRQLWQSFVKAAYRFHPVRYPIIGEREVFLSMNREDLIDHYERWYQPEHMIIAVAGNVDKDVVLGAILDLGGADLPRTAAPPYVLPKEPRPMASKEVYRVLPIVKLTKAMIGFRTVPLSDPDLYPLDVLAVALGDGRTSRLYKRMRDEKQVVLSVNAWSWTPHFVDGQFVISMNLSREKLDEALNAMWQDLEAVKEDGISTAALRRAKNKVISEHIFGLESAEDQASDISSNWMSTGDPYFSQRYVERIKKVQIDDVKRVARKYFQKEGMTLAVVAPEEQAENDTEKATIDLQSNAIEKTILPNELTLLTKKSSTAPIITFVFAVQGGVRFEPLNKEGLSRFMAGLLTKGTTKRSKLDIATALENVGGSISASSGQNTVSVSVSVLKEHFDLAIDVLSDVILRPSFPEEEIEKQRKDTLLAIKRIDENWTSEVSRLFRRHYYQEHPYRNDTIGTTEAVERFSKKDIQEFYQSLFKANNAVLAVFGDIDTERVIATVKTAFKDLKTGMLEQPIIAVEKENIIENETFMTFNEKTSAAILIGFNGLTIMDAGVPTVHVLDAVISGIGYPSGWLHEALRGGKQSLVYFIHAYPSFGIDGGYFGVMTQTTVENYDKVVDIILKNIDRIRENELDAETLEKAKGMCITMHRLGLETIQSQASSAALNEILGLGYDWDTRYPSYIESVTAADVLQLSKRLFGQYLLVATKPSLERK